MTQDSIVAEVCAKLQSRSDVGVKKYGVTLDRKDLTLEQWLTHLQEELMDATLYATRIISEIKSIALDGKR